MLNLNIYFSVFLENVMNFHEFKRPYSSSFKTNEGGDILYKYWVDDDHFWTNPLSTHA